MSVNKVTDANIDPTLYDGEIIEFLGDEFNATFTAAGGLYISNGLVWKKITFDANILTYKGFINHDNGGPDNPVTPPYSSNFNGDASPPLVDNINGVFSYVRPGVYLYTKPNLCVDLSKINVILINNLNNPNATVNWGYNDVNSIYIGTKLTTPMASTNTDGLFYATPILIEVYP